MADYRRTTQNTEVDRQRVREKTARAKAKGEASKQRSIDSRYVVAQQRAETRAAADAAVATAEKAKPPSTEQVSLASHKAVATEHALDRTALPTGGAPSPRAV